MTGTGIIPPDEFSLQQHDEVQISIDGIGTLINYVGLRWLQPWSRLHAHFIIKLF